MAVGLAWLGLLRLGIRLGIWFLRAATGPGRISRTTKYRDVLIAFGPLTPNTRETHTLNAAARVVSGTRKFNRSLSQLLHSELHWLDIPRVQYKLGVTVHRCLQNKAPQYLMDYCTRTSDVSSRQHLRSANRHQLMVPRHHRSTFGRRAFSVAGPMEWNSLPHHSRTLLGVPTSALKTHVFCGGKRRLAH